MFFSCWKKFVNAAWARRMLGATPWIANDFTDSALFHLVSPKIDGPYLAYEGGVIVQGSGQTGLYGMTLVPVAHEWHVVGAIVEFSERDENTNMVLELTGRFGFR